MSLLDKYPDKHPRTASRVIDGEAIVVVCDENLVKILNSVGSRIWELADGNKTVSEIVKVICSEYEVDVEQAEKDTVEFVEELIKSGMMYLSADLGE
jgi:hypothetical protein